VKDLIIPVNKEALSMALVEVVGEEQAKVICQAYKALDAAMVMGYQRGLADADAAFKAGFDKGAAETLTNLRELTDEEKEENFNAGQIVGNDIGFNRGYAASEDAAYDDGYVDGVCDARSAPEYADERVSELCSDEEVDDYDDQADLDGFDGTYDDYRDDETPLYHTWDPVPTV
jgi:hypothetical protein